MSQFVIANGDNDGSAFNQPASGGYEIDSADNTDKWNWYIHIDNGWDVNVDVEVQGTHYQDASFASPAVDGATETIDAGTIDFFEGTTGHSYIRLEVDPAADPTSGTLTVTFQRRKL